MNSISRRLFARTLALPVFTSTLAPLMALTNGRTISAAEDDPPLNRYPRMVHNAILGQVRKSIERNRSLKARMQTREDAVKYVESVRAKIREIFGPEPERTPLNPQVTGIVERNGYRIEKVIFESRPNFPVTANLYLPTNVTRKLPGVVGTCGHSNNGKAAEAYQSFSQGLARLGFACLIYDPIGQGERSQYVDRDLKSTISLGTGQHLQGGNQQFLVGEFLGAWRAWDGIRALDYLLSREEVDADRVGVTGNSGGGTMTTWLCGVERRWTMAAPSCFVTSFLNNFENELPADTEQCPPRALRLGLDHEDFLAAMAPRPVIILAKERDYFDVRGVEGAYARLKALFGLLGAEENVGLFVGPTEHGFTEENRLAMYQWFAKASGLPEVTSEPALTIEQDETLWCTPHGQVAELEDAQTLHELTAAKSKTLTSQRGKPRGKKLLRLVRQVLKLPKLPAEAPEYQIYRYLGSRGYPSQSAVAYAVQTEPDISAIVYRLTEARWQSRPPQAGTKATLYVAHLSSDAELREEPLIKKLIEKDPDVPFYTCDVRGIGESLPGTGSPNSFHSAYGNDYFYAVHSLMLDRPYLGQKTFDVLRVLQWLQSLGHTEIHLIGRGFGALSATFAALFSENVVQVTLKNSLTSYAAIAETEHYELPLSAILPDVLHHFDLPDCYAMLASKELVQIEPTEPRT